MNQNEIDLSQYDIVDPKGGTSAASTTPPTAAQSNPLDGYEISPPGQSTALPKYANGLAPSSPINKSPLGIDERFKLATGNKEGNMSYLKQRFEDVMENKDGNLVVKDKGIWHLVDGKAFSDVDPWTATKGVMKAVGSFALLGFAPEAAKKLAESNPTSKELMSDYADILPTAGKMSVAALAGMATGGTSVLAQAGGAAVAGAVGEGARTSLGRLEHTYQATPEQQIKDIGLESALNAMGVAVAAGVKPTAAWLAEKMPGMAKAYNAMADAPKALVKKVYGSISGAGEDSFDNLGEYGSDIGKKMKEVAQIAGSNDEVFNDEIARRKIQQVKKVVGAGQEMLGEVYRKQQAQLLKSVGNDFSAGVTDTTNSVIRSMVGDDFVVAMQGGKQLTKMEAFEALSSAKGSLPEGLKLVMRPQEDLKALLQTSGKLSNGAAFDSESYDMMKQFFGTVRDLSETKVLSGRAGANQILQANKILDDATFKLASKAEDAGINEIQRRMASYHQQIRESVTGAFDKSGTEGLFENLMSSYSDMKTQMADILKTANQAKVAGSDQPYAQLVTKIAARGGKNVPVKDSFNGVLKLAEDYGASQAGIVREAQKQIRILDTAQKFNPWVQPNLVGKGSMTLAAGSVLTGNPGIAATVIGGAAATSPRLAYGNALVVNALWSGKQYLEGLGAKGVSALFSNPEATNAFMSAVMGAQDVHEGVKQQLLSPLIGGQ